MGSEYQALTVHSKKSRTRHHREYTFLEIVLETKVALTRRRETREDIMLMLQRMMNLPQRELDKTMMILQVMKNMF